MVNNTPDINWDSIDRAIAIMEQQGLEDVRGHGFGANSASVDFKLPAQHPMLSMRDVFDSSVEVGGGDQPPVLDYTIRFPGIQRLPRNPDRDKIALAATHAADPFPEGRRVDVVLRTRGAEPDTYAAHIRGDTRPGISLFQFARMAAQAKERFYDRVL